MTVDFELDGQRLSAINGGPHFKFTEAISLVVNCASQKEIDHYWDALSKGGDPNAQQCGWLKDRYGLSWQIVPDFLDEVMRDPERADRAMGAVLKMKKLDLEAIRRAAA
jgi:predicted 3-demethylubiquinone-9 3-methyltransferase (glyoxalase superfamily)